MNINAALSSLYAHLDWKLFMLREKAWRFTHPRQAEEADYMDCFSDVYKDHCGVRPRGWTIEQARTWMENCLPELIELRQSEHVMTDEEYLAETAPVYAWYPEDHVTFNGGLRA